MKITIRELIERDGRWYGGIEPLAWYNCFWKLFNSGFEGPLSYPIKKEKKNVKNKKRIG